MMQLMRASHTPCSDCPHERELLANARPPDWQNPTPRGAYHLLVIGAGPAGLVAARAAAALGAKVALIERHLLGGDCLNTGCVPSKTIIRTSRLYAEMRSAANFGAEPPTDIRVDFPAAMERLRRIRARISRVDSASRLIAEGIDLHFGAARFVGPDAVDVGGTRPALQEGADRDRIAIDSADDSGPGRSRLPDQRNRVRPDRAAAQPARHRWRAARLRTGAGLLPPRHANRHRPQRTAVPAAGRTRRRADGLRCTGARRRRDPPEQQGRQDSRGRRPQAGRAGQRRQRRDGRGR